MKKIIVLLMLMATFFGCLAGCEKKEEIVITKENMNEYFELGVMGYSNGIVEGSDKMYVSEALDDAGEWYNYGFVYDGIEMTFLVSGKKEGYTCKECEVTIEVKGTIYNIYYGLDSSKVKQKNINSIIKVPLKEEYNGNVLHDLNAAVYKDSFGTFNEVNGVAYWDIVFDIKDAKGTLIEK